MKVQKTAAFMALAAVAGTAASAPAVHQVVTGPVAVYWMSASTTSGMGGGGLGAGGRPGGGGGRPSLSAMMAMGRSDPNAANHSLILQLGSSHRPQGDPNAEHDPAV